jgi:hypothetical protein
LGHTVYVRSKGRVVIEVRPNLFVGGGADFDAVWDEPGWMILQCAKEPWHREALGYTGRGAPKS